jgi:hypothetical protein
VLPLWLSTGRCLSSTSRRCRGRGCWSRCTSRWRSRSAIASRRWSGRRPQSLARARAATMRCVRMQPRTQPRNHATTQPRKRVSASKRSILDGCASSCPRDDDREHSSRSQSQSSQHSLRLTHNARYPRACPVASPHCRATATAFAFARCVCPHVSAGVSMRMYTYVHDASPAGGCGLASAGADTMKTHLILLSHFYTE